MKAAILMEQKAPLVVEDVVLPDKLSYGQVLVKVHYSGICGTQIDEIDGKNGPDKYLPHLLGHEGAGTVIKTGEGVKTVKINDHVVMHAVPSDGIQADTPSYFWGTRKINAGWVTTFNEYAVVSENRLVTIPNNFDLKIATLFGCAVTTAMGVINNDAKVKSGQSVVVVGVGGVGLNIIQAARMVSAYPIVAVDIHESKLVLAGKFGATHCINSRKYPDLKSEILRIVGPAGADFVINTTNNARVIEQCYECTNDFGKTILVGLPPMGENITYSLKKDFKKILIGTYGGSTVPHVEIPRYIRLCEAGMMNLHGLITHEFKLSEINKAIEVVRSGEGGRCIVSME